MAATILVVDDNVEFAVLLGTLISEQGMTPVLAHNAETALALSAQYAPSAIVLDLLLPDMTGHKLVAQLAKQGIRAPLFVMTGVFKGQAQMEKLNGISPVSGWHEKPFDTRLLVEQVVLAVGAPSVVVRSQHHPVTNVTSDFDINILDPVEDEGVRPPARSAKEPSDDIDVDVEVAVDEEALAQWDVVGNVTPLPVEVEDENTPGDTGIVIDDLLLGATAKFSQMKPSSPEQPARRVPPRATSSAAAAPPTSSPLAKSKPAPAQRVDDGFTGVVTGSNPFARPEHSPTAQQVRTGLRAKMRTGNLKSATVPRLLTAFYISQETGEIVFEKNGERKVIYISEGRPVYARSNQAEDRLGAFAKRTYRLTDEQVSHALVIAKETDRMLGEVLISEGIIAEANKQELLREQTRSIIKSLMTWTEGRYVIGFNVDDAVERAELHDHPAALVLQSVRELFDVTRLRQLVPDKMQPMPSANPPYELQDLPMGDAEALLVLRSTGARSVEEILKELTNRLDEKAARAHIYGLLALGVLVAGRAPPKEVVPAVV